MCVFMSLKLRGRKLTLPVPALPESPMFHGHLALCSLIHNQLTMNFINYSATCEMPDYDSHGIETFKVAINDMPEEKIEEHFDQVADLIGNLTQCRSHIFTNSLIDIGLSYTNTRFVWEQHQLYVFPALSALKHFVCI